MYRLIVTVSMAAWLLWGAVPPVAADTPASGSWSTVAPMPTARANLASATSSDGRIYAIGGYDANGASLATVEAYDSKANGWTAVASLPTARDALAAVTAADGRVYAIGGESSPSNGVTTVDVYDPHTNAWTAAAAMATARWGLTAATGSDGSIYVAGGCTGTPCDPAHFLNTVEAYNPSTNTWRTVAPMPTSRVYAQAVSTTDGHIIVLGGCCKVTGASGAALTETVEEYTISTNTWGTVAALPAPRFSFAAVTGHDGRIYAIGGTEIRNSNNPQATVDAYTISSNSWSGVTPMPTARGALAAATGPDGRIFAIGGRTSSSGSKAVILNTVEALTLPGITPAAPATQPASCTYVLGFKTMHDLIPAKVGTCLQNEGHNPTNGDAIQQTTGGLLVWRKLDNWTAFTDGYRTWVNGPTGLQQRLNTQRFAWEANPDKLPVAH